MSYAFPFTRPVRLPRLASDVLSFVAHRGGGNGATRWHNAGKMHVDARTSVERREANGRLCRSCGCVSGAEPDTWPRPRGAAAAAAADGTKSVTAIYRASGRSARCLRSIDRVGSRFLPRVDLANGANVRFKCDDFTGHGMCRRQVNKPAPLRRGITGVYDHDGSRQPRELCAAFARARAPWYVPSIHRAG